MSLRLRLVVPALALALSAPMAAAPFLSPVRAADCGGGGASLVNGGFEDPGVTPGDFGLLPQDAVPGWRTTDVSGEIELWGGRLPRGPGR